jgi:ABC transporter substrate binding protein
VSLRYSRSKGTRAVPHFNSSCLSQFCAERAVVCGMAGGGSIVGSSKDARSAAAWPVAAWAQQGDRVRRIGLLMGSDGNDPVFKPRLSAFMRALADLGWTDGRNVRVDVRWYGDDNSRIRALAQQLVRLQPDIIVPNGTAAIAAVQRETRTIPIVMANVADPVSNGFVAGLKQPTMWCSASCAATSMARRSRSPIIRPAAPCTS